jgi:anti-sigma regulatory factor (Ser/Thr protein kinase)
MVNAGSDVMPELAAPLARPAAGLCGEVPSPHHRTFPGYAEQVGQARHFVVSALGACSAIEDAALLTSELATNAICHTATGAGGAFEVTVQHDASCVRVQVTDDGSGTIPAQVPHPAAFGSSGRGLAMVDAMATRWGHHRSGHGRAVWFELSCR